MQRWGVHVLTSRGTPPVTTGYTVPNGFLKAYQILTQSAQPLRNYSKRVFSTPHLRRAPCAAFFTHMTRYNSHKQKRGWSYPSENTACQSDLRFKSYKFLHNITCERFDGVYGQCKPGTNVTAHISLETEHYLAENLIFEDRQYEQHARRRGEISFSSKNRCLKGSVLVARKINSGRACCSSGRVFSMLSQWRTRARADGAPSVPVC